MASSESIVTKGSMDGCTTIGIAAQESKSSSVNRPPRGLEGLEQHSSSSGLPKKKAADKRSCRDRVLLLHDQKKGEATILQTQMQLLHSNSNNNNNNDQVRTKDMRGGFMKRNAW